MLLFVFLAALIVPVIFMWITAFRVLREKMGAKGQKTGVAALVTAVVIILLLYAVLVVPTEDCFGRCGFAERIYFLIGVGLVLYVFPLILFAWPRSRNSKKNNADLENE